MSVLRFLPMISLAGGLVGILSCLMEWALGMTGLDFISGSFEDFQKYLPVTVLVVSALTIVTSVSCIILSEPLTMLFFQFFFGVAILILTSVFAMWSVDGFKMASESGLGMWMAYVSGVLIMVGSALYFSSISKRSMGAVR